MAEQPSSQPQPVVNPQPPVATGQVPIHHRKEWIVTGVVIGLLIVAGVGGYLWWHHSPKKAAVQTTAKEFPAPQASVQGLQLDTSKSYGNKYTNGVLPVGDGKYTTDVPKQGYVYVCGNYATNLKNDSGGAMVRGPWFTANNTEYDVNKKLHVEGHVTWKSSYSMSVAGGTRTIVSNDLPTHFTGIFPIRSSDPAYAYDRNPNTISAQTFTYALPADPSYGAPQCAGGEVGVMTTGVALFSAFDAGGRDAGAWEVQDGCNGHPQMDGIYHYHTLSSCITDTSVHDVIGYALDGFPITGPQVSPGNILTTSDLDECHGIVSQITLDGKSVTMYHYVMTQDFPYSVACYRATAITPPGQNSGGPQPGIKKGVPPVR